MMKFRKFQFCLFPRIRGKKKKKSKPFVTDFPRDISLDKHTNYDTFILERTKCLDRKAADVRNVFGCEQTADENVWSKYMSTVDNYTEDWVDGYQGVVIPYQLASDLYNNCGCSTCLKHNNEWPCANGQEDCTRTLLSTPNTIPLTRTRIKTNPWLPSPKPARISSTTDAFSLSTIYTKPRYRNNDRNRLQSVRKSLSDGNNSFLYPLELSGPAEKFYYSESDSIALRDTSDLATRRCANFEHSLEDETSIYSKLDTKTPDITCTKCRKILTDIINNLESKNGYDTEISVRELQRNCSSPVIEPQLQCSSQITEPHRSFVNYKFDFAYEYNVDDLLENSSIQREDTFMSMSDLACTNQHQAGDMLAEVETQENKNDCALPQYERNMLCEARNSDEEEIMKYEDRNTSTFITPLTDNSFNIRLRNNNYCVDEQTEMQDSMDTGYASVTRESDMLSTDEDSYGIPDDDKVEIDTEHNIASSDSTELEHYSNDTEFECCTSDNELEWDHDPASNILLFNFRHCIPYQEVSHHSITESHAKPFSSRTPQNSIHRNRISNNINQKEILDLGKSYCKCWQQSISMTNVELSLDEKVTMLRQEKLYVQRKITEAIYEEQYQRQHNLISEKMCADDNKQLLLQTLYDLKTKLENQGARLQASYFTVLSLQKQIASRRLNELI